MHHVGLLVFDDVDLLDVGGPYEILLTANRLAERRGQDAPFAVTTVAIGGEDRTVDAYGGLGLVATGGLDGLDGADGLDVVVVPGAVDVDAVLARDDVTRGLARAVAGAGLVATVCTGSVLLARLGLLDDVAATTTHHEDLGDLATVLGDRARAARWVDAGRVVSAGGLSNGLAMALHLVDRLAGRDLAVATAAQVEYDWDPEDGIVAT